VKFLYLTALWFWLGAPVALELSQDSSEGEQRPVIVQRKPNHIYFLGDWIRFREAGPLCFGGGIPQCIIVGWRSLPALRTTSAGLGGNHEPGWRLFQRSAS
jgi:hypothetical protein